MTEHRIHGPGQALTWHLQLYEKLDRAVGQFEKVRVGNKAVISTEYLSNTFLQRARLMTAMGSEGTSIADMQDRPMHAFESDNLDRAWSCIRNERDTLNTGETHYVSQSVMDSIDAASQSMEPEALYDTDLPCPSGLIVFEYPMLLDDLHPDTGEVVPGLTMPIRAIGWSQQSVGVEANGVGPLEYKRGIVYTLYSDHKLWLDFYVPAYEKLFDRKFNSEGLEDAAALGTWLSDMSAWAYGMEWGHRGLSTTVTARRKWLLTYFRWTWQRITSGAIYAPTRTERKLAMRMKRPLEDGKIKVVQLRRSERQRTYGENDGEYKLDHRYIARGHWRRQHYRTLGPARTEDGQFNEASHRLVWIEAHIRGPENAPLIVGHNVSAAVR